MPTMTESTGLSRVASVRRADEPAATRTTSSRPAPTASAETTSWPVGLSPSSSSRTTSSLRPDRPESLRVETTVPTTWPRITRSLPSAGGFALADGQHVLERRVRARDDVHGDDLADARGGGLAGLGRGPHGCDVAPDDRGDVAAADLLVADQLHLGGLDHGVRGFDHRDEAAGLDEAERIFHRTTSERVVAKLRCRGSNSRPARTAWGSRAR